VADGTGQPGPELRVALFTGNYNYIKDGVALTLNRLVAFLESRGVPVLVFAPVAESPAFASAGELVPVPSFAIPGRPEYRIARGLPETARQRLAAFRPTLFHIAVPDILGYQALKLAERWGVPVVASYHTRYDTYLRFYGLGFLEPLGRRYLRHFYNRVRRVYPPSESMAEIIRRDGQSQAVEIWARGVDSSLFAPDRRSMDWRRRLGMADGEVVISYAGRLVKEKNTAVFMRVMNRLTAEGRAVRPLVIGDGPELVSMKEGLMNGVFAGFLHGEELATAYASSDIFFFPSESETFGNVTLEAMASGLPAVNALSSGSNSLVQEGATGRLVSAGDEAGLAAALAALVSDAGLRQRMGKAARQRALDYSWDSILSGLLASYERVLHEAKSTAHDG
jgi:glycosyltransferase involved in cell wall biosynthesis